MQKKRFSTTDSSLWCIRFLKAVQVVMSLKKYFKYFLKITEGETEERMNRLDMKEEKIINSHVTD